MRTLRWCFTCPGRPAGPLEILVQAVRGARPKRLDSSSQPVPRPGSSQPAQRRLELLCAANLAFRHVPFEFGGKAEPDLTWNPGTGAQGWLEIHRGAFSLFDDFQQALDRELTAKGAFLTVRLGAWPVDVRDRNVLHTRISNAIDASVAARSNQVVAMPELGDGVTGVIEPQREMPGIGRVLVQHAGITPSEGYLASVSARLARKVNVDKAGQGRKGKWDATRTALLVDISTAHLALLLGQDGLAAWLDCAGRLGRPAVRRRGGVLQRPPRPVPVGELPVPARPQHHGLKPCWCRVRQCSPLPGRLMPCESSTLRA